MNLKEKVKECIIQKNNNDYMVLFEKVNSQEFVQGCIEAFYYIENSILHLYLKNEEYERHFFFEIKEKRTLYKLKKEKKITFIETLSDNPFHYTLFRGIPPEQSSLEVQ